MVSICPDGGMVDTGDLKSPDYCSRAGSSPVPGTTKSRKVVLSPSGKAAACKAAIPGSNPGGTSTQKTLSGDGRAVEYTGLENRRG